MGTRVPTAEHIGHVAGLCGFLIGEHGVVGVSVGEDRLASAQVHEGAVGGDRLVFGKPFGPSVAHLAPADSRGLHLHGGVYP